MEKRGEEMMEERRVTCPCKRINCPRHGDCASCRAHHHISRRNGFTWCEKLERKQQKEKKKQQELLASVAVGDSVLTTSGFYGVIIDMTDDTVIVEFGSNKNCRIPMRKDAIVQVEKPEV